MTWLSCFLEVLCIDSSHKAKFEQDKRLKATSRGATWGKCFLANCEERNIGWMCVSIVGLDTRDGQEWPREEAGWGFEAQGLGEKGNSVSEVKGAVVDYFSWASFLEES